MILDTNGLSAIADGDPELEPALRRASEIAVPVIVLGEYRFGIMQSRHRGRYEEFLAQAIAGFRVLPVDVTTTEHYARVRDKLKRAGRPIPENDVWIAALTVQHELPLLSRDLHFDYVQGLQRIGW